MRDNYHQQLDHLKTRVAEMATLAKGMLEEGVTSLIHLDLAKAQSVIDRKDRLAELDDQIENEALQIAGRQQPMAKDLRALAAALKLITYVNRLGRYGKDIAQIALQWGNQPHIAKLVQIPHMAEVNSKMLDATMDAYRSGKPQDLEKLKEMEDTLDAIRYAVFRECVSYMMEAPANIERCAHYMMIARYLERCGDNICKMAEKIHYMNTGVRIVIK
jgi:phosphate transport system protein